MATRGQIPNSRVIPKPPGLRGKLGKLKQESVIKLVLDWLDNGKDCPLSHSLDPASRRLYYRGLNGGKRALYDALSYDWANGLNVLQQADIELQCKEIALSWPQADHLRSNDRDLFTVKVDG